MRWLFLLFTVLPIIDLWLLLRIGGAIGFWPTLVTTVSVALVGAWLAKREGGKILAQWRRAMAELRMPEEGVVAGAMVVAGAALLAAPGVLTDVVGLALLLPPTRRAIAPWIRRRVGTRIESARASGTLRVHVGGFGGGSGFDAAGVGGMGRRERPVAHDDGFTVREVIDTEGEVTDALAPRLPPAR